MRRLSLLIAVAVVFAGSPAVGSGSTTAPPASVDVPGVDEVAARGHAAAQAHRLNGGTTDFDPTQVRSPEPAALAAAVRVPSPLGAAARRAVVTYAGRTGFADHVRTPDGFAVAVSEWSGGDGAQTIVTGSVRMVGGRYEVVVEVPGGVVERRSVPAGSTAAPDCSGSCQAGVFLGSVLLSALCPGLLCAFLTTSAGTVAGQTCDETTDAPQPCGLTSVNRVVCDEAGCDVEAFSVTYRSVYRGNGYLMYFMRDGLNDYSMSTGSLTATHSPLSQPSTYPARDFRGRIAGGPAGYVQCTKTVRLYFWVLWEQRFGYSWAPVDGDGEVYSSAAPTYEGAKPFSCV